MDIQSLYDKLISTKKLVIGQSFDLNLSDLDDFQRNQVDTRKVKDLIFPYFPSGEVRVGRITIISSPPSSSSITFEGRGDTLPFLGMRIRVEIHLVASEAEVNQQELAILMRASGGGTTGVWTFAKSFPFYQNSLLSEAEFLVYEDPDFPNVYLASHNIPDSSFEPGAFFFGLLDLDSIRGRNYRFFLGQESQNSYIEVEGFINAFISENGDNSVTRPYVSLFGALPEPTVPLRLGIFSLENVRYGVTGFSDYNTATWQWQAYSYLTWLVDLVFTLPSQGNASAQPTVHKIPIAADIYNRDGRIRFRSNLEEGISLVLEGLSGLFQGIQISLPSSDFKLQDYVKLTELELLVNTDPNTDLIEFVALTVETDETKNRWVLVDKLLVLQAIDFYILVSRPGSHTPSVNFSLSGLIGIGEKGTLRLTTDFSRSGGQNYYSFHGGIAEDSELNIKEIFAHFVGYDHPDLPNLEVHNFTFSIAPPIKSYSGEIELDGHWEIPGIPNLFIEGIYFYLNRTGEAETSFVARAAFRLANIGLFIEADYESIEKGWTFEGGTYEDSIIPVGNWIQGIVDLFSLSPSPSLPPIVQGLELTNLGVKFNTRTKDFSFHGTTRFPINGEALQPGANIGSNQPPSNSNQATLTINLELKQKTQQQSQPEVKFSGLINVLNRHFALIFDKQSNNGFLVGVYDSPQGDRVALNDLIQALSTQIPAIPAGLTITLRYAQLAIAKAGTSNYRFLFSTELKAGIELSQLPIVGQAFTREQTLSVIFHILAASENFSKSDVEKINSLTPATITKLPSQEINISQTSVQIQATVRLGGFTQQTDLALKPIGKNDSLQGGNAPIAPASPSAGTSTNIKWIKLQKTFGPFHFERLGLGFVSAAGGGSNLAFLLDASLMTAGLTLTLEGFGAECALADLSKGEFKPTFHLDGLGVDFKKTDLEIGGALIRKATAVADQYQYDGAVIIHYKQWEILAYGSYQTLKNQASLFVYALVNYPLGGPAFFFVEGLAAGFGYNRSLKLPSIDTVATFPLVKYALEPAAAPKKTEDVAKELYNDITPAEGQYFLTLGVKFNSFKQVDGFVLLTVMFGQHFEIDVLGLATLTVPNKEVNAGKPPLAKAQLSLLARFLPDEGFLGIQAKLTPDSHVFSEDCHLTGGFAFYCWFANAREHQHDFALTLGGYHPNFDLTKYPHYPQVPRLALNWQLKDYNVSIKADAYFAMVPSALMVGGHLQVNWQSGDLRAWFNAALDCLIAWQPYHYEASMSVAIGAAWRSWSVDVAAELDLWGPEFCGKAHIKWFIISFDIEFGQPSPPAPLTWGDFATALLPEASKVCTVSVQDGKVTNPDAQPKNAVENSQFYLGVINPHQLCIVVHSAIPILERDSVSVQLKAGSQESFASVGIAPIGIAANSWKSSIKIEISQQENFEMTPIFESVPSALWSASGKTDPKERSQENQLIENVVCGYEIRPKLSESQLGPSEVGAAVKETQTRTGPDFLPIHQFQVDSRDENARLQTMKTTMIDPVVRSKRDELLEALKLDTYIDWSGMSVETLRNAPKILTN